jgi:hypothetical protein
MTVLRNNFDGGPAGTTLTAANSGQSGNNAFNLVSSVSGGSVLQYYSAADMGRGTAEFVLKTSTAATAKDNGGIWSTAMGSQTQVWWRQYLLLTQTPDDAGMSQDMTIFESDNGAAYAGFVEIGSTSGKLWIKNGPTTLDAVTTNALPLGEWVRIEAWFKYSTTVGAVDLDLYLEPDSDTPTETLSVSGWNMGAASANAYCFGSAFSFAFKPVTYFSGIELNNTGFPGPLPFKQKGMPGIQPTSIAVHSDVF